jgi:hypothetical protein
MKPWARLKARSIPWLVRLACMLALAALAIMAYSIVNPRPLAVIFAMSVGHVLGIVAFVIYFASVLLDVTTTSREQEPRDAGGESRRSGE